MSIKAGHWTSLYRHDIILVLFYWIKKQDYLKKISSLETGASLGFPLHKCLDNKWPTMSENVPSDMIVRPAKIQISLRIRAVWSESSQSAFWIAKDRKFLHADNEDSDQTTWMRRLIWVLQEGTFSHVEAQTFSVGRRPGLTAKIFILFLKGPIW